MKRNIVKNNQGFAITSFLYAILVVFLVFLSLLLVNIINSKLTLEKLKNNAKDKIEDEFVENTEYAKLVIDEKIVNITVGEEINLLEGVSLKRYDGETLSAQINYEDTNFNNNQSGTYLINYSTMFNEKIYTNYKIINILNVTTPTEPFEYAYAEKGEIFIAPISGYYKIEAWGAQGGNQSLGGNGAYTSGVIKLNKNEKLYIYVGGTTTKNAGGYNGGGNGTTSNNSAGYGGGGATDIRYFGDYVPTEEELLWNSTLGLNSRIMVAAGGGGGIVWNSIKGSAGGALNGIKSVSLKNCGSQFYEKNGGTQTTGYAFGQGQNGGTAVSANCGYEGRGGAGSGYYGGYAQTATGVNSNMSGSSGSSYISGYMGSVAITSSTDRTPKTGCTDGTTDIDCSYHYSGKVFEEAVMISGNAEMPSINGRTETGHTGNGYVRIEFVSSIFKVEVDTVENFESTDVTINITSSLGLSPKNTYQYYLSTSNSELVGGQWTSYVSGKTFEVTKDIGKYYLWIYPLKDIEDNVNDNQIFGKPYMISEIDITTCTNIPEYTYTGESELIDDGDGNWRLKFLTDGDFELKTPLCSAIDVFAVGGGGGGGQFAGGGGGYTKTVYAQSLDIENSYSITIGQGAGYLGTGGTTTGFGVEANGGAGGTQSGRNGGAGGSGGGAHGALGGINGSNGDNHWREAYYGGAGQRTTTREFETPATTTYIVGSTPYASNWLSLDGTNALTPEIGVIYSVFTGGNYYLHDYIWNGTSYEETDVARLYAGGGDGMYCNTGTSIDGGGGSGLASIPNTGGGGGSGAQAGDGGKYGGSGIVIIRNAQ